MSISFKYLFLICLCINQTNLLSMNKGTFIHASTTSVEIDPDLDQIHKAQEKGKQKTSQTFSEREIALYKESFDQANIKVKVLIEDRLKGELYTNRYRSILLAGLSGAGKSTLAEAIFYTLKKPFRIVDGPSLLGHYRDQAAEKVHELFEEFRCDPLKRGIVLQEVNVLTDGYLSDHSDTQHTAAALWTELDSVQQDDDFFLIATANVTKEMPPQLQKRFKGRTFAVENPSVTSRQRALEFGIKNLQVTRDESCSNSYLAELAQKTTNFSHKDIEALLDTAILLFSIENRNAPKRISKIYLEKAYADLAKEDEKFWDFSEKLTPEERRHREIMEQNRKQFEANKELQVRVAEYSLQYQSMTTPNVSDNGRIYLMEMVKIAKQLVFPEYSPYSPKSSSSKK